MKKRIMTLMFGMTVSAMLLAGCGQSNSLTVDEKNIVQNEENRVEEANVEDVQAEAVQNEEQQSEAPQVEDVQENISDEDIALEEEVVAATVRIGSLKGPTSIGLMHLMDLTKSADMIDLYEFEMAAGADELLPKMVSGDLDIALVPANVAGVLYNKTQGGIKVVDINTLGVLYAVTGDDSVQKLSDLQNRTVYLTGKGTTPDYVIQYLIKQNDILDVTLEYKSEATEVAAVLAQDTNAIGILPQPFATATCMKNENLQVVLDLTKEWDACQGNTGSRLVTGVTVVRTAFLEENEGAVKRFMESHRESADFANENVQETAELVAEAGIIEKAPLAARAIPNCNITYIEGTEMKSALSGYLQVLFEQDPTAVGGAMPGDDFYYEK